MHPHTRRLPNRELTAERLERLLARLGSTDEEAAARYNAVRDRLVHFFSWRRCDAPEDLADEVLDRVARRLDEGDVVGNLTGFCLGVARMVALEASHHRLRERQLSAEYARRPASDDPVDPAALACLERCLDRLAPDRRAHLLTYYGSDQGDRIEGRHQLARSLGVGPVALRNRMLRLRRSLEECLRGCVERASGWTPHAAGPPSDESLRSHTVGEPSTRESLGGDT